MHEQGTGGGSGDGPAPPDPEREVRRLGRRYGWWLLVYLAGFGILWAGGLWHSQAFYWWAIGWVLVWSVGVQRDYFRRYLRRPPPGRQPRQ